MKVFVSVFIRGGGMWGSVVTCVCLTFKGRIESESDFSENEPLHRQVHLNLREVYFCTAHARAGILGTYARRFTTPAKYW